MKMLIIFNRKNLIELTSLFLKQKSDKRNRQLHRFAKAKSLLSRLLLASAAALPSYVQCSAYVRAEK